MERGESIFKCLYKPVPSIIEQRVPIASGSSVEDSQDPVPIYGVEQICRFSRHVLFGGLLHERQQTQWRDRLTAELRWHLRVKDQEQLHEQPFGRAVAFKYPDCLRHVLGPRPVEQSQELRSIFSLAR